MVIHVTLRQIGWPVMTSYPTVTIILMMMMMMMMMIKCIPNEEVDRDISHTLQL